MSITKTKKHFTTVALVLALLALTSAVSVACSGGGSESGSGSSSPGGTFRIAIPDDVTTNNPWDFIGPGSTAYNFAVYLNRYSTVMKLSDQKFQWVPDLAADYPTALVREGDFWVSTVTLKDNVEWSDGEAVDANDVAFTINTTLDLKLTGSWSTTIDSAFVDRVEAVNDTTVKYYLKATDKEGNPQTPGLAVWQYGVSQAVVLAEHFWAPKIAEFSSCGEDDADCQQDRRKKLYALDANSEPITGPASFIEWQSSAFVALDRNQDSYLRDSELKLYADGTVEETVQGETSRWLAGSDDGSATEVDLELTRPIDPDRTIYSVYNSQAVAVLALQDGEVDYFLSPLGLSTGLKAQVVGKEGVSVFENPSNGFRYLAFNFDREPFNDKAFRTAVALLIDRDLLATRILQNAVSAIYTPVPEGNGYWFNSDVPEVGRKLDDDGNSVGMSREERIVETVRVLKTAGYTWDVEPSWDTDNLRVVEGEGLKKPDGTPIAQRERLMSDGTTETIDEPFELLSPGNGYDPLRATSAIWIEQWLSAAGIPVVANLTGFNEIVDKVFKGATDDGNALRNFDMWILGWGLEPYPDHLVAFFTEAQTGVEKNNAGNFVNAEYEAVASKFQQATEVSEARKLAFEMQEILGTELPYVTLFSTPIIEAYRPESVQFAYTEVLDGVQNLFQNIDGTLTNAYVSSQ